MALLLTPGHFIALHDGLRVETRPKNAFLNGASLLQAGCLSNRVTQRPQTGGVSTSWSPHQRWAYMPKMGSSSWASKPPRR